MCLTMYNLVLESNLFKNAYETNDYFRNKENFESNLARKQKIDFLGDKNNQTINKNDN
jgi:hypothetical protein